MTSEVVIANNQCVVMAADSAVTTNGDKVHDSALKLFSLSKIEPVGIMIFGSGSYLGTPWETIIKVFRDTLRKDCHEKLGDYCDRFIEHLDSYPYWSELRQQLWIEQIALELVNELKKPTREYITKCATTDEKITDEGMLATLSRCLDGKRMNLQDSQVIFNESDDISEMLRNKYSQTICEILTEEITVIDSSEIKNLVVENLIFLITRNYKFKTHTGIVIAGFGSEQLYPQVININFDGVIENKTRHWKESNSSQDLNDENLNAVVIPFAQDDVMNTLLCGISPYLDAFIHSNLDSTTKSIKRALDAIKVKIGDSDSDASKAVDELTEAIGSGWQNFQKEGHDFIGANFVRPLHIAIASLTKADMAMMAETLINITAFKRKISSDANSVGGPVDVAVLSKGDGLVWVKRKHYFPAELNGHFFQNYLRGY